MVVVLTIVATLLFLSNIYLLYITIRSNTIHQNSYEVSVALAEYINNKANEFNGLSVDQAEAEIEKTLAEADNVRANSEYLRSEMKPEQKGSMLLQGQEGEV